MGEIVGNPVDYLVTVPAKFLWRHAIYWSTEAAEHIV
jgi:hypothetical protein